MPSIGVDFTQEQYDRIPGKKRTWLRDLALRALETMPEGVETMPREQEYAFKTNEGKVLRGPGRSPGDAARRLGLVADPLRLVWLSVPEAEEAGWFKVKTAAVEDNPMGV